MSIPEEFGRLKRGTPVEFIESGVMYKGKIIEFFPVTNCYRINSPKWGIIHLSVDKFDVSPKAKGEQSE